MSTPDNSATQQKPNADSLEQKVKAVMATSTFDEETGKVTLPDDIKDKVDADTLFAVGLEHRRRNTQSGYTKSRQNLKAVEAERDTLTELLSYTKSRQNLKAVEAERDTLTELLSGTAKVEIPKEEQERLETLKYEDPDKWRKEIDSIEKKAIGDSRAKIAELTGEAKGAAEQTFEVDRRQQVLSEFNESAEVQITEELIAQEVPPRITNKLAEGKISFEKFLEEVAAYVGKGKVVNNEETLEQPNLGNLAGGKTPGDAKAEESTSKQYKDTVY